MSNDQAHPAETEQSPTRTRRPGRPRGRFDPRLDWDIIEREYVTGIPGQVSNRSHPAARHWPTFRELAARHDVSHARVHQKSKVHGWKERREICKQNYKIELDSALTKAAALSTAEQVQYLDDYIRRFGGNIRKNKVRADAINDLDKAARLREFLLGNADSRSETSHKLTLEAMQSRFADRQAERHSAGEQHAAAALAGVINEAPRAELSEADPAPPPHPHHERGQGRRGGIAGSMENLQVCDEAAP